MGTELLVAGLWGVVLAYWLWSRRPTTADTVGVFRRELRVLQYATPSMVVPANRRCPDGAATVVPGVAYGMAVSAETATVTRTTRRPMPAPPRPYGHLRNVAAPGARPASGRLGVPARSPLEAAALGYRRAAMRRRRRDLLCALGLLVLLTLLVAVLTGSALAIVAQLLADIVAAGYVYLLVQLAGAAPGRRAGQSAGVRRAAELPLYQAVGARRAMTATRAWDSAEDGAGVDLMVAEQEERQPIERSSQGETVLAGMNLVGNDHVAGRGRPVFAQAQRLGPRTGSPLGPPYRPEHVRARPDRAEHAGAGAAYGDFGSYASLALAHSG